MVMERKMLVMQWYVILFGKRRRRRRRKEGMLKIKYKNIKKKIIKKNARSM